MADTNNIAGLSDYDYWAATHLHAMRMPFYSMVAACMLNADTPNLMLLRNAFPGVAKDLYAHMDNPDA